MKLTRQDYILAGGQALLWITLWLIPPAIDFFIRFNPSSAFEVWKINTGFITPLAIVFTANFYVLVPYLLYRDRKMLFGLMNLLLITGANLWIFSPKADFPDEWRSGMYMVAFGAFFLHLLVVGCAVGFRYIVRWGDMQMRLKEERQKNAEAELAWLKNQLNPHFLFNTLNNISSLVQIDQDTAQESIGQFSRILYVTGLKDYVMIYLEGEARPLITHVTMKAMEEMLPSGRFMRVHRSYIVALDKIRSVDRNNCVYIGKEIIHVTDAYKEAFNAYLKAAQPS